jgi:hypothetical protein
MRINQVSGAFGTPSPQRLAPFHVVTSIQFLFAYTSFIPQRPLSLAETAWA